MSKKLFNPDFSKFSLGKKQSTLFCFSPEVMLTTFIVETILALSILIRYRLTAFGRAAAALLSLLAIFQLSEYQICVNSYPAVWMKVGLAAAAMLPIAGLYMISLVIHKNHFLKLGYILVIAYIVYFVFVPRAINRATCGGNYVIFHASFPAYWFFGLYYFIFLLLGIWESLEGIFAARQRAKITKVLTWFVIGYSTFMVPMFIIYVISENTRNAIASIMCGFAIIFAFIIALKIVPDYHRNKLKGRV